MAPVLIRYIKLLPAEAAQRAWQQLSAAVANSPKPAKFTFTTALLVTFMDPELLVSSDGTLWGEIAVEAGEEAMSPNKSGGEAVKLIRSLMISRSEYSASLIALTTGLIRILQGDLVGRDNHDHLLVHLSTALSHRALTSQEDPLSDEDQAALHALLGMLAPAIDNDAQHLLQSDIHRSAFPQIFWLAFVAQTTIVPQDLREQARQLWQATCCRLSNDSVELLSTTIRTSVLSSITDIETAIRCVFLLCSWLYFN